MSWSICALALSSMFFFSSRRRHTRFDCDWSSDVCSSDLGNRDHRGGEFALNLPIGGGAAFRVAGYKVEKDSPFKNAGRAQDLEPAGVQDDRGARLSFLYQPDDKLSIFAMADIGKEGGTGYPGANVYTAA